MNHLKTYSDFLFEWDPSMSTDPSAPFNQEDPFTERNEPAMLKAEGLLRTKGHDIPENFWELLTDTKNNEVWEEFDSALEKKFTEFYEKTYEKGFDKEHDTPVWTDEYHKVRKETEAWPAYKAAKSWLKKKLMENALVAHLAEKHIDEIWPVYEKAIKKLKNLSEATTYEKYKGEEIMYSSDFEKYFVSDEEFDTMAAARKYIDDGMPPSEKTINAYRHGAF